MATPITPYLHFALNSFLSQWPEGKTLEELIELFDGDNEDEEEIGVWYPFENWPIDDVFDEIVSLAESLERNFIPRD